MYAVVLPIFSLLFSTSILLSGIGLLGTQLGVRAGLEHFPDLVAGLVMAAYFVGFIIGTFVCPRLIRRIGHIRGFAALAAVASAVVLTHALWVEPWIWAFARLLTGICMVGLYMVIESWLNALAPNHLRGRVFGLYMIITLMAMVVGQFVFASMDPWGFAPFVVVAMLLSLALVPVVTTRLAQPEPVSSPSLEVGQLFRISPLGSLGCLTAGLINGAFWGMGALLAQQLGYSRLGIALFMSAIIVGGAMLQWPVGRLSDRMDRRRVLAVVCFSGLLTGVALYLMPKTMTLYLAPLLFLYGGALFTVYSLSVAHTNDLVAPSQVLETTRGLLLLYGVGAAVGPALTGIAMQVLGPSAMLLYTSVFQLLLGLFSLRMIIVRRPVPEEEKSTFVPMVRTSQSVLEMHPAADTQPELELKR